MTAQTMNESKSMTGASPTNPCPWEDINWPLVEKNVKRLQMRIAKAIRTGRFGKAKALQRILTHSFYGKCLAVKRVALNKGSKTPGVDNILWHTGRQKMNAAMTLKRKGYKPQPLKRLYIPKTGGKLRPLSLPTMKDRAMQALWKLALEPICEEQADPNTYGFRPKRCVADAIGQCLLNLSRKTSAQWVLEGDIKSCFDTISHEWLLKNIPMDKTILNKFLKAGFMDKDRYFPTEEGTPQGGIISPTLTVMTLSGLEKALKSRFKRGTKVNIVFYADDFIITGNDRELLKTQVKPFVKAFLKERGLELSEEKTTISHIDEGFDFLGFTIRKYNGKFRCKPSKASVKRFLAEVRANIRSLRGVSADRIILTLNPKIRGWYTYYRHVCSSRTYSYLDYRIYESLTQWVHRRHSRKNRVKALKKYFKSIGLRNWVFSADTKEKDQIKTIRLYNAASTKFKRYDKIRGQAHPFDLTYKEYLEKREQKKTKQNMAGHKQNAL